MNPFDEIHKKRQDRIETIFKGIDGGSDMLEKARQVGDTKTGSDGIMRVWSKTPKGFDWRRVKGNGGNESHVSSPKPVKTESGTNVAKPKRQDAGQKKLVNQGKRFIDGLNRASEKYHEYEPKIDNARRDGNFNLMYKLEASQNKWSEKEQEYSLKIDELKDKLTEESRDELEGYYGFGDLFD